MAKKEVKKEQQPRAQVSITMDTSILEYLDKQAEKLLIPRSRLIENCVLMAVDDIKLLERLGLLDVAKIIRKVQERLKEELKEITV